MRKSTGSLQISPRRLLSLLLIHILVVFAFPAITGVSSSPGFKFDLDKYKDRLTGGNSFVSTHILMSHCSQRFVRMNPGQKVDAKASPGDRLAVIKFKSVAGGDGSIQLQGNMTNRFLCFTRRGRPRIRYNGKSDRCRFHEIQYGGYIKLKSVVRNWYLGFNKHGRRLSGFSRKRRRRDCYKFIKLSPSPPYHHQLRKRPGPFWNLDPTRMNTNYRRGKR